MKSSIKSKEIDPVIVAAIIERGYVRKEESKQVFGTGEGPTENHTKLRVCRPGPDSITEGIWVVQLAPETYVFSNQALAFYPNRSWGTLCFTTKGVFDFKKTEANLKRCYDEYTAHYVPAKPKKASTRTARKTSRAKPRAPKAKTSVCIQVGT